MIVKSLKPAQSFLLATYSFLGDYDLLRFCIVSVCYFCYQACPLLPNKKQISQHPPSPRNSMNHESMSRSASMSSLSTLDQWPIQHFCPRRECSSGGRLKQSSSSSNLQSLHEDGDDCGCSQCKPVMSDEEVFNQLHQSLSYGYSHIDCVEIFRERQLGMYLNDVMRILNMSREDITIGAKCNVSRAMLLGRYCNRNGRKTKVTSKDGLLYKHCKRSLKDLHTPYIDIFVLDFGKMRSGDSIYTEKELKHIWKQVEHLHDERMIRQVAVKHLYSSELFEILSFSRLIPVVICPINL